MIHNDLVNLVELFVDVSPTLRLETMTPLPGPTNKASEAG